MPENLKTLLRQAKQAAHAHQWLQARQYLEQALQLEPQQAALHFQLAGLCADLGDWAGVRRALAQTLALDPDHVQALYHQAKLHLQDQHSDAARECLQRCVAVAPDFYQAWLQLGNVQREQNQLSAAQESYRRCTQLRPQAPEAWYNLGLTQEALGLYAQAIESFQQALALKPGHIEILYHLGNCQREAFDLEAAAQSYTALLEQAPEHKASWWSNLANVYLLQQDWTRAEAAYAKAQALEPNTSAALVGLSNLAMLQGDLQRGYALYVQWHQRFSKEEDALLAQRPADWDGQIRPDQPLVVLTEQGLGDMIQYVRYLPLLAAQGQPAAIWNRYPPLQRLLRCLVGLADLEIQTPPHPPTGTHAVWMTHLPSHMGIAKEQIPASIPYFAVPPIEAERLQPGRRVGLVWASGRKQGQGRYSHRQRSAGLSYFLPLLTHASPALHFYSFQVGPDEQQLSQYPTASIHNLAPALQDLYETARWLQGMDLVITVDTAVAHLAGALGVPVWILLPYTPDGRWLLTGQNSPWYPSARLFRQPAWRDWAGLFAQVHSAFAAWLSA